MTSTAQIEDDYEVAKALVLAHRKTSTSWLQRQLRIGYNSAARLIEQLECEGVVSGPDHIGRRAILMPATDDNHPALVLMAEQLAARGARVERSRDGGGQLVIPVALPEESRAADDRFRLLIKRVERLEEEKKGISDDIRDVWAEAKATGYDAKVGKQIVRLRKMRPDDRREMEAILDSYKCALGID